MAESESRTPRYRLFILMAGSFVLGFLAMHYAGRWLREREQAPEDRGRIVRVMPVDDGDVGLFLDAVRAEDFAAMGRTGERAFRKGVRIPDHAERFGRFETNSFPPYTVYAFYYDNAHSRIRRVLLTVDADGVVDSFMAEEMKIVE